MSHFYQLYELCVNTKEIQCSKGVKLKIKFLNPLPSVCDMQVYELETINNSNVIYPYGLVYLTDKDSNTLRCNKKNESHRRIFNTLSNLKKSIEPDIHIYYITINFNCTQNRCFGVDSNDLITLNFIVFYDDYYYEQASTEIKWRKGKKESLNKLRDIRRKESVPINNETNHFKITNRTNNETITCRYRIYYPVINPTYCIISNNIGYSLELVNKNLSNIKAGIRVEGGSTLIGELPICLYLYNEIFVVIDNSVKYYFGSDFESHTIKENTLLINRKCWETLIMSKEFSRYLPIDSYSITFTKNIYKLKNDTLLSIFVSYTNKPTIMFKEGNMKICTLQLPMYITNSTITELQVLDEHDLLITDKGKYDD